jgi:N-acylneuraminate cytidylyltransferase
MIDGKKVLGLIPARGGSKGVPGKNIRVVGGEPLIAWTIKAARNARLIDRVVLTSDDPQIVEVARQHGCDAPFLRPPALATDASPTIDAVLHALDHLPGYDYLVLLQPTSPLRTGDDIDECIKYFLTSGADSCATVVECCESPYWMYSVDTTGRMRPVLGEGATITRRQDLPRCYSLNGAIYVASIPWIRKSMGFLDAETVGWIMPRERSIDIDTERDFEFLQFLMDKQDND